MPTIDMLTPAESFRVDFRDRLLQLIYAQTQVIEGGELDGTRFLSEDQVTDAIRTVYDELPLPEPSDHAAELRTPGRVVVAAVCPRCGVATPAALTVHPILTVDGAVSELKLKVASKAVAHVCDQLTLDLDAQATLDEALAEVGDDDEGGD